MVKPFAADKGQDSITKELQALIILKSLLRMFVEKGRVG
jgi:hypothetical protein